MSFLPVRRSVAIDAIQIRGELAERRDICSYGFALMESKVIGAASISCVVSMTNGRAVGTGRIRIQGCGVATLVCGVHTKGWIPPRLQPAGAVTNRAGNNNK